MCSLNNSWLWEGLSRKRIGKINEKTLRNAHAWGSEVRGVSPEDRVGTSMVVQWLRPCALNTGGLGSIPGGGTKCRASSCSPKKRGQAGRRIIINVRIGGEMVVLSELTGRWRTQLDASKWLIRSLLSKEKGKGPGRDNPDH